MFRSTNFLIPKDVLAYLSRAKELLRSLCQAKLSYYQNAQQRCRDEMLASRVIDASAEGRSHSNPGTPRDIATPPKSPSSPRQGLLSFLSPVRGLLHSASASHVLRSHHTSHLSAPSLHTSHTSHSSHSSHSSQGLLTPHSETGMNMHSTPPLPRVKSSSQLANEAREGTPSHFHMQVEGSLVNISRATVLVALQFAAALQSDHKDVGLMRGVHRRS